MWCRPYSPVGGSTVDVDIDRADRPVDKSLDMYRYLDVCWGHFSPLMDHDFVVDGFPRPFLTTFMHKHTLGGG